MIRTLIELAFAAAVSALICVDVLSRRRTASLRAGRGPPHGGDADGIGPRAPLRSSRATFLAAAAGLIALAWGVVAAAGARYPSAAVAVPGGAFVAAVGLRSRVAAIVIEPAGLRVRYAGRPAIFRAWASIRSLQPPRTPFGAWRMDSPVGDVTLMPSDLLGHEVVLDAVVAMAGLSFDGRSWRRESGRPP